ncbi:PEP/pyruvate-binding domain-containing protein [Tessaracoccus caeni]|uniref:PEP/pyruvate-binding domain-containing protein n=1 Tax=Tessaracoccus caeni TaxID=3031239 RepID=UPI0023DCA1A7|nr:PEP/pyruvate-binding domain-containing protein [Tessaracoccus caeni]MDF1487166.1 PEP/pyruvate-binding domain-containing protein [Tessaracoccus caeni]
MSILIPLPDAHPATCGGKAATLAVLARAGLPVPDGFVVPFATVEALDDGSDEALERAIGEQLTALGHAAMAVRSSASSEDTAHASAAGQYESTLAVRGPRAVLAAIRACRSSLTSSRAADYWTTRTETGSQDGARMAVLVQRLVDAKASGVMFTPTQPGGPTRIEASWGLGPSVVDGVVTPDSYEVDADGSVRCSVGTKATRLDRNPTDTGLVSTPTTEDGRLDPALEPPQITALVDLGAQIARLLGAPQDVEWALADGELWILQARPITAPLPSSQHVAPHKDAPHHVGTPGSHGTATGTTRVVLGPSSFHRITPGDVLVCPYTDPAWTPLFRVVSAIVTETGGALSHAAIVAREHGIPAVLGVVDATTQIPDGARVTVDGTAGTVTLQPRD